MLRLARSALVIALVPALAACGVAADLTRGMPNMDAGSAGCQNAVGIGPTPNPAQQLNGVTQPIGQGGVMPELIGLSPKAASDIATANGHTVVFNVDGSCWCVPPELGAVTDSWWGQHGALWLWVDGAPKPAGPAPFLGWGC